MVGRRRGLVRWGVVCVVAAGCGGKSHQDDVGRPADSGGSGAGEESPGSGGTRSASGAGQGGVSGVVAAAGEAGTLPEPGAGGANGGAPSNDAAGTGGAGGAGGENAAGPGDINADGCVDLHDWVILGRGYGCSLSVCGDPRADLFEDGWIDQLDYVVVTQHWYEGERCRAFCIASGEGGAGGDAGHPPPTDLSGDDCIGWDDFALLADSYGCDASCAAPNTDVVADGCVDDRDLDAWKAAADADDWCE